jgi:hypothetical protein
MLSGRGVVACGFDVDHSLVDALLLGLNLRAEVLQTLIGLGDIRDQFRHGVRLGTRVGVCQPRDTQRHGHAEHGRSKATAEPGGQSERRAAAVASHSTWISYGSTRADGVGPSNHWKRDLDQKHPLHRMSHLNQWKL